MKKKYGNIPCHTYAQVDEAIIAAATLIIKRPYKPISKYTNSKIDTKEAIITICNNSRLKIVDSIHNFISHFFRNSQKRAK